jgi:hypothetical protein
LVYFRRGFAGLVVVVLSMVEHPISGFPLIRASEKRGEVHN